MLCIILTWVILMMMVAWYFDVLHNAPSSYFHWKTTTEIFERFTMATIAFMSSLDIATNLM